MRQVRTLFAVGLCVAAVGTIGCKGSGGGPAGKAAEAAAGASEAEVLDLYVFCFNELDQRIRDSWDSYVEWVDPAKGPTGKEKMIDGIDQIDDYRSGKCLGQLQQAQDKLDAASPLAAPTLALVGAINKLLPLVAETKTYYDRKDYKDDAFAKGQELNGKLVAAFDAWKQANGGVRTQWEARHKASRDQELAKLEQKEGRKSERFVTSQVMNVSEQLIETADAEATTPEALRASITAYQAAFDELDKFFGQGLTASTDTDRFCFRREAEALLIQTKEAVRALDKAKALPKEGDGSRTAMIDKYNALVETSNGITWD